MDVSTCFWPKTQSTTFSHWFQYGSHYSLWIWNYSSSLFFRYSLSLNSKNSLMDVFNFKTGIIWMTIIDLHFAVILKNRYFQFNTDNLISSILYIIFLSGLKFGFKSRLCLAFYYDDNYWILWMNHFLMNF